MAKTLLAEHELGANTFGEVEGEELIITHGDPRGLQVEIRLPVKAVAELLVEAAEPDRKGSKRG